MINNYQLLLECYLTGQISEKQWQQHLENKHFKKWLDKRKLK